MDCEWKKKFKKKKKKKKKQFYPLTDYMCIIVCNYHATFFINNKNEWFVSKILLI